MNFLFAANSIRQHILPMSRVAYKLWRYWLPVSMSLAILTAILLPLNLLSSQRFHHDEALYATWALKIVSGDDPWLTDTPIDKPPLFLYTVAGAMGLLGVTETVARLPSLIATALTVLLTFWLGRKLYSDGVGLLAAWLVALSPFTILFAPTAFTDPMLVAFVLASCLAASYNRAGWAGIFLGLAIATKQQGVFFMPLVMVLLVLNADPFNALPNTKHETRNLFRIPITFLLTLLLTVLPALIWDFSRNQPSGFFEQSLNNYGGLFADFAGFYERGQGFLELLVYGTASPLLNIIFLVGIPVLLIYGLRLMAKGNTTFQFDWSLVLFTLAFLLLHVVFSFQVWDRYLLGLIPLLALVLARVLLLPYFIFKNQWPNTQPALQSIFNAIIGLALFLLLALALPPSIQDATNARYPLGSNSQAVHGIEQITAYLQGNVGADSTLYHHWLGTHWRFYLWDYPYDLQYWETPTELVAKAKPEQLIAFPAWHSDTEVRLALFNAGLSLHVLTQAYVPNGTPSITLYRIEAIPPVDN